MGLSTFMVGEEGFEPSLPKGNQILSLTRLPFRHSPKLVYILTLNLFLLYNFSVVTDDPYEQEQQRQAQLRKVEFILVKLLRVINYILVMVIRIIAGVLKSLLTLFGLKFK